MAGIVPSYLPASQRSGKNAGVDAGHRAIVTGVPDPVWGQKAVAIVKLVPGWTATEKDVTDFLTIESPLVYRSGYGSYHRFKTNTVNQTTPLSGRRTSEPERVPTVHRTSLKTLKQFNPKPFRIESWSVALSDNPCFIVFYFALLRKSTAMLDMA